MTKHVMAITYQPKIKPVLDGRCTQTIRAGRKASVGDEILFHGWEGRPYRSKWSWRKRVTVIQEFSITVVDEGLWCLEFHNWNSAFVDMMAHDDFIDPPTGESLRDVLFGLNGAPKEPAEYQIIRW